MNVICTAYVLSRCGHVWEIGLTQDDMETGEVNVVDHIEYVVEGMIEGDEVINIVFH